MRVVREDDRFRLGKDVHEELFKENGTYIFDDVTDDLSPRELPADRANPYHFGGPP